jgi:hypothetical protein
MIGAVQGDPPRGYAPLVTPEERRALRATIERTGSRLELLEQRLDRIERALFAGAGRVARGGGSPALGGPELERRRRAAVLDLRARGFSFAVRSAASPRSAAALRSGSSTRRATRRWPRWSA